MNAMNKVLREYIPQLTMAFLDDVPIKGCAKEEKDERLNKQGCTDTLLQSTLQIVRRS